MAEPDLRLPSAPPADGRPPPRTGRDRNGRLFRVPILVYHRVSDDPNPALAEWAVRPRAFRRQVRLLQVLGYRMVTLDKLLDAIDGGGPVGKMAVVTFDDGYRDTITIAAPILDAAGFPATVFVVTDRVGETAEWDASFGGEMAPLATWAQLRERQAYGWEIGLHTRTHPRLGSLSESAVREELAGGTARLERELGLTVRTAAYPYGDLSAAAANVVAACGLRATVTTRSALMNHRCEPHALPRLTILRRDTLLDVVFLIWTGQRPREWGRAAGRAAARPIRAAIPRTGMGPTPIR